MTCSIDIKIVDPMLINQPFLQDGSNIFFCEFGLYKVGEIREIWKSLSEVGIKIW